MKKTLFSKTVKGVNTAGLSALRQCLPAPELWQRGRRRVWTAKKRGKDPAAEDSGCGGESSLQQESATACFPRVQLHLCAFISFIHCSASEQPPSRPDWADKLWLLRPTNCPSDFLVWKGTAGQWSTGLICAMFHSSQIKADMVWLPHIGQIIFLCIPAESLLSCASVAGNTWGQHGFCTFVILLVCYISVTFQYLLKHWNLTYANIRGYQWHRRTHEHNSFMTRTAHDVIFLEWYASFWCIILFLSYSLPPLHPSHLFFHFFSLTPSLGHIYDTTITECYILLLLTYAVCYI